MIHRAQKGGAKPASGRFWNVGRSLAAAGTALLLLVTGGVGAAVAAPPYTTNATVSNINFVKDTVGSGSSAEMTAEWTLPDNPTPPAGMTIALPPELAGRGDTFVITASDTGETIANCVARATQLECDFDAGYISENPRNLHGNVNFWVVVKKDVTQTEEESFTVNGQVVTVTVTPPGGTCTTNCDFLWDNRKDGAFDYANNTISWYVHIGAPEAGMAGGQKIEVTDTPGPNQSLTVTDTNPLLMETNEKGPRGDGAIRPQNWQIVPRADYSVDANGTVVFTTKQGYFYQVKYVTDVTDNGATGDYTNRADFTINGQSGGGADGHVRYAGGGGTGIGDNVGVFSITKKVEGDAANLPSDLKFTGTYTVTTPAGDVLDGDFEVAADGTWESDEFPRDSTVHLNEVTPTSPSNINWATPVFSKNDFKLEGGKLTEIQLTNTASVKLGKFSAAKSFDGTKAAQDLVPENATFDLDYSYPAGVGFPAGSGTLKIGADGQRVSSPDLPMGAEVTVTEKAPAAVEGLVWGTPEISPSTFTIGDGTEVAIQVKNPVTEKPTKPTTPTTPEKPAKPELPVTGAGDGAMLGLAGVAGLMLAAGAALMARKRLASRG
ncbi:hypothetical protein JD292_05805 [Leucobacter sp. CSA2]|uniref:Gram-positive cocci surface proteins LPxTG domain-containing protein n=1 Tax=Leucobacter edaphi TaxID=2796472 RepID=A0A934QBW2_9MICO|nr:DUF5979 domain-containing protein [Leucobacter edaphi]MBK0421583.1 hypothetical protein [Leucobacter edaphi]